MKMEDVLSRLSGVRKSGGEYMALCPAHADRGPSLSITEKDGKILLHCHAGCDQDAVRQALGLQWSDLFSDDGRQKQRQTPSKRSDSPVQEWYDYTDESGEVLYQVGRKADKSFIQRRKKITPNSAGWEYKLGNVRRVLYRLPAVLQAIQAGETIYIPEGEKDVHTLESLGLTATTASGGAKAKWLVEYTRLLEGVRVVIFEDNDSAGIECALAKAQSLHGKVASVRLVTFRDLPMKSDVTDWIEAGHTKEDLLALVEETPVWEPSDESTHIVPGSAPDGYPLTDLGNAERLILAHGKNLRFDVDSKQWLIWDGKRWTSDSAGEVHRLARGIVRRLYDSLKDCGTTEEKDALFGHVKRSESAARLEAMVKLAQFCLGIPVQASDLDADPWLLNCENGTVDLRTGDLKPHAQTDLLTKLSPAEYHPGGTCPRWMQFLEEVFAADAELIGFVKRMSGYLLTGDTREQCFFLLTGKGSNGKSVLSNALSHVLGDYARSAPVTSFLEKRGESTLCDLAGLTGARLVSASEGEDRTSFSESLLKQLTGGDPITARHLFCKYFTFKPTFKIIFATNEVPRIKSQNYAMRRRVKLIPFKAKFYYPHEMQVPVRDETLGGKLKAEASGILAWMVQGCLEWQREGLGMPAAMQSEVDCLFDSMDLFAEFLESECELHPGYCIPSGDLWKAYQQWCEDNQQKPAVKRPSDLSRNLCARDNIEAGTTGKAKTRVLRGIRLKHEGADVSAEDSQADAGGRQNDFSERFPMKDDSEKVLENSEMASAGVRLPREPPSTPCPCGSVNWHWQPLAYRGAGAWVCTSCFMAMTAAESET